MAAYAALVNLLNVIDQIQENPRLSITFQQNQIQLLQEKLHFLVDFIESGPLHRGVEEEAEMLEHQIASAAYAAEDVIENHVVDQIQAAASSVSLLDLQTVIQDMDCVKQKVATFKHQIKHLNPTYYTSSVSTPSETPLTTTGKSKMVGFDEKTYQLMDALTGHESALQIIPIVGMGGIGKTTLAKNVYQHSLILQRFDIRAWATISLEYTVKDIFSNLLSLGTSKSSPETEYHHLAQKLYQSLIGRRYLIVLDDVWSIEVWDKIKFFFPDNNNGSRVVVTTRLSGMATHFGTSLLQMQLLDADSSWKLFCQEAFPEEGCCPSELVEIGMKIAKKCKGLPLLIIVIGAVLRKSSGTPEYWEDISNDINSILNTGDHDEIKFLDILRLSYGHLPAHLKPCFLYLGIYPEDRKIEVSPLIKLWVAEGFVKSNKTESLEAVAWGYLHDLIDRNLLICVKMQFGKTKECQMHDLLRELCLKRVEKENFFCVIRAGDMVDKARRIVFERGTSLGTPHLEGLESASPLTRSLVGCQDLQSIKFKLLRVLNMPYQCYSWDDILKKVNLRYVHSRSVGNPGGRVSSISLLWNLQTLIIGSPWGPVIAPPEIWEMRQLRHLKIWCLHLPDPPLSSSNHLPADDEFVLPNLQSLEEVRNLMFSEEVCRRLPNLKELNIIYDNLSGNLSFDFGRLHKLEYLHIQFTKIKPNGDDLLPSLTFPSSLQQLTLEGCHLRWEDLSMIGSLPHLQFLELHGNAVTGRGWSPLEGEFVALKLLKIYFCDLIDWNISNSDDCYSSSTFPVLEKLHLYGLRNLNEIPSCIGEIPTLDLIHLYCCSESAAISAMKILEEQESLGNDCLQVEIEFGQEKQLWSFKGKVQHMDCFTSTNLHFRSWGGLSG